MTIFIGMKPTCCLSDLVREIKKSSNTYIKDNNLTKAKFNWQEGFGAFSYSHSHMIRHTIYCNQLLTFICDNSCNVFI